MKTPCRSSLKEPDEGTTPISPRGGGSKQGDNMGLDAFQSEDSSSTEEIRSRKKIENLELEKEEWVEIFAAHPYIASFISDDASLSERKAVIQTLDEILDEENDEYGADLSDEDINDIETHREAMVEEYIRD